MYSVQFVHLWYSAPYSKLCCRAVKKTNNEKRDDETDVNDAFSGSRLSPDVKLFSFHVLKSSLVKHNTKHALNITASIMETRPNVKTKTKTTSIRSIPTS